MKPNNSKLQAGTGLVLVPQTFLDEISETQNRILELLSEEKEGSNSIGDFIPEAEAAKLLGRKTTWFWKLRKAGTLGFTKVGNKVFYSKQDILDLLQRNKKSGNNE
jgi:hypothetical protein